MMMGWYFQQDARYGVATSGKRAVVVGRSTLVGLPMVLLLGRKPSWRVVAISAIAVTLSGGLAKQAGGVLGLFTAIRRLRAVHGRIADRLARAGLPLYAQHVDPIDTGTLVDIFRDDPHASLLGTDALRDGDDQLLVVRAEDRPLDLTQPRGKQYWEPKSLGIFYTRTTGIWQPVWVESRAVNHIQRVKILTNGEQVSVEVTGRGDFTERLTAEIIASDGTIVARAEADAPRFLRRFQFRHVNMGSDESQRPPIRTALDLGLRGNPPDPAVARPDTGT